jgi:hypothetical protein
MADEEFGDKNFGEFMENDDDHENNTPECPKINGMLLIVSTIREKMKFINMLYKESLMRYEKLKDDDSLKPELKKYIIDLMAQSTMAMDQLDFALLNDDEPEPEGPK